MARLGIMEGHLPCIDFLLCKLDTGQSSLVGVHGRSEQETSQSMALLLHSLIVILRQGFSM